MNNYTITVNKMITSLVDIEVEAESIDDAERMAKEIGQKQLSNYIDSLESNNELYQHSVLTY
tara:strand:- start:203 stop:388 length:186 start_codon:yes stop_codon:yes gene_type:complete